MNVIETGNAELDADLSRINELLKQTDLEEHIENDPAKLLEVAGGRIFALMFVLVSEDRRGQLCGVVSEGAREPIQFLSEAVTSKFGPLLNSEEAMELAKSSNEDTASFRDEVYDAVRSLSDSGFLLEIRGGRLLPHLRANVFAAERRKMATLTMEWDDCLFLCSSLIEALNHYMKSFHSLMEQRTLVVDADVLSQRSDILSEEIGELNQLIGDYHSLSKE